MWVGGPIADCVFATDGRTDRMKADGRLRGGCPRGETSFTLQSKLIERKEVGWGFTVYTIVKRGMCGLPSDFLGL